MTTRPTPPVPCAPLVTTCGDRRTLEFAPGDIQSAMLLSDPTCLVLAYCRAIMCFALFVPRPRHIVLVGLGGGSLAKFCFQHFPQARISVLELRADVIALREQFGVPPDDARFRVLHADAATWLGGLLASADVLVVDGFDVHGLPPALGSARFYADCRRALCDGGVLVANVFSYDPHYRRMLARLRLMFDDRVCRFNGVAGNNRILFAVKAGPGSRAAPGRALRVQGWVARLNPDNRRSLAVGLLNRLLVRTLVAWLARGSERQQ
ncbi:MAG: transferase spermidine synthase [Pseudomonadota bacterium]